MIKGRQKLHMRKAVHVFVVGVVAWMLVGCGSSDSQVSTEPPVEISEPTEVVETTGTFEAARTYTVSTENADGSTGEVQMEVGKPADVDDTDFPSEFSDALSACVTEADRDLAIPVRISLTSQTDDFESDFSTGVLVTRIPNFPDRGDPTIAIGAMFSDGPDCNDAENGMARSGVKFDAMSGDETKKHDFVVIVHDFYSPRNPEGNKDAIKQLRLYPLDNNRIPPHMPCQSREDDQLGVAPALLGRDEAC